ncbi:hypothetical protein [Ralstonia thomasii]
MSTTKQWILAIASDVFVFGLLGIAILAPSDGAMRVFTFWVWAISILGILVGVLADKSYFRTDRPKGMTTYGRVSGIALMSLMVWCGMISPAIAFLIATVLLMAAREREPKAKAAP